MIGDGVLNAGILSEISCNGVELACAIILLCVLRVHGLAVPRGAIPVVPGEGFLHAEEVVGVLGQFGLTVAGLQNELRQRHGGEDARVLHVGGEKAANLLDYVGFGKVRQCGGLRAGDLRGFLRSTAEFCCDLAGQITHSRIHPISRTGLVCKPTVDRQDHLVGLWRVGQRRILIAQPQELLLTVALADVHTELDQCLIDLIPESVGLRGIGGTLDGHSPLVVFFAGGAPAAVFLLHIHADTSIRADAIVAGSLSRGRFKDTAQRLHRTLADHTVRRDAVNTVRPLAGMVGAQLGVDHHRAVRVCHYSSPPFSARSCSCSSTAFSFSGPAGRDELRFR